MNQLDQNINTLQEKIYSSVSAFTGFQDISKNFLPDDEIAINIVKKKSPEMSDDQARQIVKGSSDPRSLSAQTYPLKSSSGIYTEVKNVKNSVRQNVMLFVNSQVDIVQDLAKISFKVANSISGAAVLIAPLSFNVPAAISLVLVVVDGLSLLVKKATEILVYLGPMSDLILVLPKNLFDSLTGPINAFIKSMIQIIDKISSVKQLIDSLIGSLLQLIDPANLASMIQSLIDQITQKKSEREILNITGADPTTLKKKDDEISELQNRLNDILNQKNIPKPSTNGKFPESSATDFLKDLNTAGEMVENITEVIYDMTLPDGSVILDVDPDTIEKLKGKYNVVYKD
ncbi:hypothetical protein EBU94_05255 [bacterium]|nr:hypothetical protein [bacterium]